LLFAAVAVGLGYYSFMGSASGESAIDGLVFPESIRVSGSKQTLVGGGTRFKYGAVKVYAAGLYLDGSIMSSLKKFSAIPAAALTKTQAFFDVITSARQAKTMLLRFHRSVGAPAVIEALRDALKPKVDAKGVSKFESALSNVLGETVPKDSQLFLTCKADSVYISTSESTGSHVNAKGLCPALFGVYLGKSPISPAIKSGVATGFTKLE